MKTPWGEPYEALYFTSFSLWQDPNGVPISKGYEGPAILMPVRVGVPASQLVYYKIINRMCELHMISEMARLTAELRMYQEGHPVVA